MGSRVHRDEKHLRGDDLDQPGLESWFAGEQRAAVAALAEHPDDAQDYGWREQQRFHVFAKLPARRWRHVLGFGSASGAELLQVAADAITIVEAAPHRRPHPGLRGPVRFVPAQASGDLALPSGTFDLAVSFGALHHVANVSHVLSEVARVATAGGYLCMGEPIVSMGQRPEERRGMTPNERGLPLAWLREALDRAGWDVRSESLAEFPLLARLWRGRGSPWNSPAMVRFDAAVCAAMRSQVRYVPGKKRQQPSSVYMTLQRRSV